MHRPLGHWLLLLALVAMWGSAFLLTKVAVSGVLLGIGIAGMHYTGMGAMVMEAMPVYDSTLVMISILIGIVAATAALWIMSALIEGRAPKHLVSRYKIAAALIMGLAICGMHYVGMAAAWAACPR